MQFLRGVPRDVASLIAGPIFYICDGCVTDAIRDDRSPAARGIKNHGPLDNGYG